MQKQFALCIDNANYEASLIQRKLYEILPDTRAGQDDMIRVIDESGKIICITRIVSSSSKFRLKSNASWSPRNRWKNDNYHLSQVEVIEAQ